MSKKIKTAALLLLLITALLSSTLRGAIPAEERAALIALYNSTNGDNWDDNSGWKEPPLHTDGFGPVGSENSWYGIWCDAGNTTVVEISLYSNNLDGSIPKELENLTGLVDLALYWNQLTGPIPPELGNLTNLVYLDFDSNQLTGTIPPQLGNLTNLEELYLSSNQLSGEIPAALGNLTNLCKLHLSSNQLTGAIPAALGNLTNLYTLRLSSNQLSGEIPAALGNLTKLRWLYLSANQLTAVPPELGNLTNLRHLYLDSNQLTAVPPELGNLINLRYLYLSSNQLSGAFPPQLGNLTNLLSLYLCSNKLSGEIPGGITSLTELSDDESDFRWNALYTNDDSVRNFLNEKQEGGNWDGTQTIAPIDVSARGISDNSIEVSWEPIAYSNDDGGYRVYYSQTQGGPYTLFDSTPAKYHASLIVTGLTRLTTYYFVVQTWTAAHTDNKNYLESEYSAEVSAATLDSGKILSGEVTTGDGKGLAGVRLFFSPPDEFVVTNAEGYYRYTVDPGWTGKVTPVMTGYDFDPKSYSFADNPMNSDRSGVNFTAIWLGIAVSGRVTNAGEAEPGVTLQFIPDNKDDDSGEVVTGDQGTYIHAVPFGWQGTVKPEKGDLLFTPGERPYSGVTEVKKDQDYELSIAISLAASWHEDRTVLYRKYYGIIEVNVALIGDPQPVVNRYIILRKDTGSDIYQERASYIPAELVDGSFAYEDKFLDKDKSYTYKVEAHNTAGKVIGVSKERTIEKEQ